MAYCTRCGAQIPDSAAFCQNCGNPAGVTRSNPVNYAAPQQPVRKDDTLVTLIKVFLILGCVAQGWLIIPLAWCLPITIKVFNKLRDNQPISTGLMVCTLLFVNIISGILLLCDDSIPRD